MKSIKSPLEDELTGIRRNKAGRWFHVEGEEGLGRVADTLEVTGIQENKTTGVRIDGSIQGNIVLTLVEPEDVSIHSGRPTHPRI